MALVVKIGAEMRDFDRQMKKLTRDVQTVGNKLKGVGQTITAGITLPLAAVGAASIKTGVEFESSMSKVAAISGATGDDLEALEAKAREMGATTQFSASEAADALSYMAMAGWKTEDMLNGIDGVMNLAAASGEDLAMVSDIVTDALTAFGLSAADSGRFADVLAAASSNANTNVGMLGESFKYVAPVAGALGYSVEDTSKALSLMANAGIKGSQSGTALRTMLTNLASPTAGMKKAMDELGISLTDNDGNMKTLDAVMQELRTSFDGLGESQQAAYASTIFGKEAMSGALAIINASEQDYNKLTDAITNSDGAAQDMAATMNDNLAGRFKETMSALEKVALTIYENLQPALETVVAAVKSLADWFNNLSPAMQNLIIGIAGLAAVLGPLLIAVGVGIIFFGQLKASLSMLSLGFLSVTGTVLAVIAVLTALGALFVYLWNTSDIFRNTVTMVFEAVKAVVMQVVQTVVDFVMTVWGTLVAWWNENSAQILAIAQTVWNTIVAVITTIIQQVVSFVMQIWSTLTAFWQEHGQMILEAAQNVWNVIQTVITTVISIIVSIIQTMANVVMGIMQALWPIIQALIVSTWEAIKGVIQGAIDVITGIVQAFSALFTGNWSALWDAIKQILSGAVQFVWNLIQVTFVGKIVKAGKTLAKTLSGTIKSMWEAIRLAFMYAVDFIKSLVSKGFNVIKTTVTTVMNAVRSFISGIWNAIKSVISSVMSGIRSTISSVWNAVRSVISGVLNGIRNTVSNIWNGIRSTISNVVNNIRNTISNIFNSLRGIVSGAFNNVTSAVRTGIGNAYKAVTGKVKDFFNAGKNIVTSIADGIKGAVGKVKDAISNVTQKIRDFLPFSPAKEGALRDIMDIQVAQSIAQAIDKGKNTAVSAMAGLTNAISGEMTVLGEVRPELVQMSEASVITTSSKGESSGNNEAINDGKLPAEIPLYIGSKEIARAVVDDVTEFQKRSNNRSLRLPKTRMRFT